MLDQSTFSYSFPISCKLPFPSPGRCHSPKIKIKKLHYLKYMNISVLQQNRTTKNILFKVKPTSSYLLKTTFCQIKDKFDYRELALTIQNNTHFSQDMEATHTSWQYFPIAKHIHKDHFMANLWLNVLL